MMTLVPAPYRWLALALLAAAAVGFGWVQGARRAQAEFDVFQAQVEAVGREQGARTRAVIRAQQTINATSEADYAAGNSSLRNLYGPGRVRKPDTGRSPVPAVPDAPRIVDAGPADTGSGPPLLAPGQVACAGLVADAAVTTRQLIFLQDWAERQALTVNGERGPVVTNGSQAPGWLESMRYLVGSSPAVS